MGFGLPPPLFIRGFQMAKRDIVNDRNRFKAIRRLCTPYPPDSAGDRLKMIEDVASGKAPADFRPNVTSADMAQRIADGQASRSPRAGEKPTVSEKKRSEKRGHDRSEKSGTNRTTDLEA